MGNQHFEDFRVFYLFSRQIPSTDQQLSNMTRAKTKKTGTIAVPPQSAIALPQNEEWEAKIDHLKTAYASSQEVIKFIDTKSNILIGLSTVAGGFATTLLKWALELDPKMSASWESVYGLNQEWAVNSLVLLALSLCSFLILVLCCLFSVLSRKAPQGKLTLLFPVARKESLTWKQRWARFTSNKKAPRVSHKDLIRNSVFSLDPDRILEEYAEQLTAVGKIIEHKLNHNRWASVAAVAQLAFLAGGIGVYFAIACGLLR